MVNPIDSVVFMVGVDPSPTNVLGQIDARAYAVACMPRPIYKSHNYGLDLDYRVLGDLLVHSSVFLLLKQEIASKTLPSHVRSHYVIFAYKDIARLIHFLQLHVKLLGKDWIFSKNTSSFENFLSVKYT